MNREGEKAPANFVSSSSFLDIWIRASGFGCWAERVVVEYDGMRRNFHFGRRGGQYILYQPYLYIIPINYASVLTGKYRP